MNGSDNITPSESLSMTQPLPALPSLPPSPVSSSLPPLSPSPSPFRRNSLRSMSLSPSLLRDSPSAHVKKRAGKDMDLSSRHYRSVSMDSCFNDFLKLPPSPGTVSSACSVDGDENTFGFEFENEDYTADELKMISKNAKLTEISSDPKRYKRRLANREAAARSKQRVSQQIIDLQNAIEFYMNKRRLMFEKITLLEKDITLMKNENNEIRIRLESMEQQAQLHDEIERLKATTTTTFIEQVSVWLKEVLTLNEQLRLEVQRMKMLSGGEVMQNLGQFDVDGSNMHQIDPNMFRQLTINEFNQSQTNPDI